jgi:hypothetical protein
MCHIDTQTKPQTRNRQSETEPEPETETEAEIKRQRERERASLAAESIRTDAIIIRFAFPILLPTLATTGRIMIAAACRGQCVSICTFVLVKQVN